MLPGTNQVKAGFPGRPRLLGAFGNFPGHCLPRQILVGDEKA